MNAGNVEVRKITLDDLPGLRAFLQKHELPAQPIEKKFAEFQAAFATNGEIVAIAGLQLANQQGLIHTVQIGKEGNPAMAGRLWERIQSVARNHGLFRLWSKEPFPGQTWPEPTAKELERLPEAFGPRTDRWHVLQLKEENVATLSLDQEFQLFTQSQKESSEQMMRQARAFKIVAYVVAILFGVVAAFMVIKTFLHPPPKKR